MRDDAALQLPRITGALGISADAQADAGVARQQVHMAANRLFAGAEVALDTHLVIHIVIDPFAECRASAGLVTTPTDVAVHTTITAQRHADLQPYRQIIVHRAIAPAGGNAGVTPRPCAAHLRVGDQSNIDVAERLVPRSKHMFGRLPVKLRAARITQGERAQGWIGPAHARRVLVLEARTQLVGLERAARFKHLAIPPGLGGGAEVDVYIGVDRAAHGHAATRTRHRVTAVSGHIVASANRNPLEKDAAQGAACRPVFIGAQ